MTDQVETLQGSPLPLETAQLFYRGVLGTVCEFDEFDENSPLNRVVAAAARAAASTPLLARDLRRRARRIYLRFERVTELQAEDMLVEVDRRSHYYMDSLSLAKDLLAAIGRLPTSGAHLAWSFLIPTPRMVEAGVRQVLSEHLPHRTIENKSLGLPGSTMSVNPDLVLDDGLIVGDIKYKTNISEWSRSDLYQTVAFATAYNAAAGVVVAFGDENSVPVPTPIFGGLPVRLLRWSTSPSVTPEAAAVSLAGGVDAWIKEVEPKMTQAS